MAEQKTDAPDNASVTVEWDDKGLHISTAGPGLTPDQLILAAHYLRRTADQLLDGEAMRRATAEQAGIIPFASVPADLKPKGVS